MDKNHVIWVKQKNKRPFPNVCPDHVLRPHDLAQYARRSWMSNLSLIGAPEDQRNSRHAVHIIKQEKLQHASGFMVFSHFYLPKYIHGPNVGLETKSTYFPMIKTISRHHTGPRAARGFSRARKRSPERAHSLDRVALPEALLASCLGFSLERAKPESNNLPRFLLPFSGHFLPNSSPLSNRIPAWNLGLQCPF